jgi:Gpi18-like mannosyltransferase
VKLYQHISIYFVIWLLVISFISYFSFLTLPHSGSFDNNFFESFSNWDGGHFLGIAQYGFSQKFQYAFFPLYPLVIRFVNEITHNYLVAAILISVISAYIGLQLLYKLIILEFDKKFGERVILSLLFFPTSFYFLTAYSEGLFFLLSICAFYFFKTKKILISSVFISLACMTRLSGLAVALGLMIEVIVAPGINKKNWYILLSPIGFLIYCFYLYSQTGDPFYFIYAEGHWQRSLSIPVLGFWETIKNLSVSGFIGTHINAFIDLLFAVFGVGLGIRAFRFLPISYCIYFIISILFPLFTPTLSSMPRFLLPIFPIFILVANIKNKYVSFAYQLISIILLSFFTSLFINGYWVS